MFSVYIKDKTTANSVVEDGKCCNSVFGLGIKITVSVTTWTRPKLIMKDENWTPTTTYLSKGQRDNKL